MKLFIVAIFGLAFVHSTSSLGNSSCLEENTDYTGNDITPVTQRFTNSWQECDALCNQFSQCLYWTWKGPPQDSVCWLKTSNAVKTYQKAVFSGPKGCSLGTCWRPSYGCTDEGDVYKSVDCDGDGILDHTCHNTIDYNRWLVLSSEGCPNSWGQLDRPVSACPQAFGGTTTPTTITTTPTTTPAGCEDTWPTKKCSKKCNAKKCLKSKSCKKNCKNTCDLCGIEEPCEDQKSSKFCKKQLKKGKCSQSSVWKKCKKTCDAC